MFKIIVTALIFTVALSAGSCTPNQGHTKEYPDGVGKFDDGNITCYTYYDHAISCVKRDDRD